MTAAAPALPVSADDLRNVERALFQNPGSRFSTTQRLFFEALLGSPDFDYRMAAKRVGIRSAKAKRWLEKPDVQKALNHLLEQRMRRANINPDALLLKIVDLLDMATGDKPIKRAAYDAKFGGFVQQEVNETDLAAAARFTDQLARHLQLYAPEGMQGMQVTVQLNLAGEGPMPATAEVNLSLSGGQDDDSDDPDYGDFIDADYDEADDS